MVDDDTKRRILSRFASSLGISTASTESDIRAKINQMPEHRMVHPRDMLEELDKLLAGEITLPAEADACQ